MALRYLRDAVSLSTILRRGVALALDASATLWA